MGIIHGDCIEEMKKIPDNSIDMVLTDPPYGTTKCKWDNVIDFELMWRELKRITKDNGAICLFGSEPFSSHLRMSNIKMFKYDWVWRKSQYGNFVNAKNCPLKEIETISVFSQGTIANGSNRKMVYYPQGLIPSRKKEKALNKRGQSEDMYKRKNNNNDYITLLTNYPKNIIYFSSVRKPMHPTQKPVALLEYLIKTYTLESETVLDFTMGSGSTGVACKNLNRKFIGIEKDETYFDIAKDRIENHIPTEVKE